MGSNGGPLLMVMVEYELGNRWVLHTYFEEHPEASDDKYRNLILALNPGANVLRVIRRVRLDQDSFLKKKGEKK